MNPARDRTTAGIAFVVASAVAFGAMAILARYAFASGVDTATLLALRFGIAALVMWTMVAARRASVPRGKTLATLIALGAIGYGGQSICYFTALRFAPAGLAALLLYLHPAIVAVLAAVFLHERLGKAKLAALVLALAGTTLTIAPAIGVDSMRSAQLITGMAFAVASAIFYSAYIVVAASIGRRAESMAMSTVVISSAAAVYFSVTNVAGPHWPQTSAGWLAIVAIALLSTVMAITFYLAGLERIGPVRAATLSTIEPLCAVVMAALLLNESLDVAQLIGGVLILVAAVVIAQASAH